MSNRDVLKEIFGFDEFRDKQEDVIEMVLRGQSCLYVEMVAAVYLCVCVYVCMCIYVCLSSCLCVPVCVTCHRYVAPTGCGKSLTFQLPALKMDGLIVVISPLLVLMHDQVSRRWMQ